jgi:CRISPR-associated endoribonuclease Cas6
MKNFVVGTFEKQEILLHYQNRTTTLHIAQAEYVPEPHYAETMRFRLLSPLTLSTMVQKDGNLVPYYYRYTDKELVSALKKNLCAKYQLFHKNEPPQAEFEFEFDRREIDRKNGRVSKLITIAEGTERESKVKAIQCGFRLKTNPGLMHIGYECGFGEKNSMGFGMSEVIR